MYLYTLKILHFISKLNFVAHGVKFDVLELIYTYDLSYDEEVNPLDLVLILPLGTV